MRSLSRLSMLVCVVAALSFVALAPAQAGPKKHEGSHHRKTKHEKKKHAKHHKEKGAQCAAPEECAAKLDGVLKGLKAAQEALKNGHTEEASKKLAAAIEHLEMCKRAMKKHSAAKTGKPVNTTCPIMGGKVDPDDTPKKLTRTFQGKTVGFCCAMCPGKWDKLSDEEKTAKLEKVTQ